VSTGVRGALEVVVQLELERVRAQAHPALRSVRLVRFADGTWADIAVWSEHTAAEEACGLEPLPEVEAFFSHIAEDVSMDVTTIERES
jgi:hypothetical protein